jgi:hypothetical protein
LLLADLTSNLKMEAVRSSETFVNVYQITGLGLFIVTRGGASNLKNWNNSATLSCSKETAAVVR